MQRSKLYFVKNRKTIELKRSVHKLNFWIHPERQKIQKSFNGEVTSQEVQSPKTDGGIEQDRSQKETDR